jgi:hypothetical protein
MSLLGAQPCCKLLETRRTLQRPRLLKSAWSPTRRSSMAYTVTNHYPDIPIVPGGKTRWLVKQGAVARECPEVSERPGLSSEKAPSDFNGPKKKSAEEVMQIDQESASRRILWPPDIEGLCGRASRRNQ